jgi:hypothetical protein
MQSIYAHPGVHLALGRKGENVARQVVFDLRLWRAAYGDGAVSLCAMRAGDAEPYPCGVTQDEDTAVWVLRAADVDKPGWGNVQLSYYVGDTLAKSQTWRTLVAPSLCACGDPGEVQQGWLDQAGKDAAAAQQGAKDAQEAQKAAEDAAEAAKGSAEAAAGAAKAAQDATEHPPRINEETQTWLTWQDGAYRDTGLPIAIDGSLPPGGDPGDIVVRTADGAQWQPDQLTDEELLQAMIDTDTLPAVHDTGGILTDENGRIILW